MSRPLLIGDVFRQAARAVPGRAAAVHDERVITFGALYQRARLLEAALHRLGVDHGARVALWSSTSLDVLPIFAALACMGGVFVPVPAGLGTEEAEAVLRTARISVLVTDDDRAEAGEELATRLSVPLVRSSGCAGGDEASRAGPGPRLADLASAEEPGVREPPLEETDAHVVFLTSGSTGQPKGVVLSHRVNYLRSHPGALLEPKGPMVCPYPLFHMGAWTIALQQWQAREVVVFTSAKAEDIAWAVRRHRATRLNAIPAVWHRILALDSDALRTLRWADTGTSATPPELLDAMRAAAPGARVRVFYGSTEAGSVAMLEHADLDRKPGRVGLPGPGVDVRTDPAGELLVRSPLLFDGYFDDPGATEEAFTDGWFRTGDLVAVDEEGYLSVVGRARDVIRTGGETVAPAEVEEVLTTMPGVADLAVVGIDDPAYGEVVCLVVVPADGARPPSAREIGERCNGRLASFKHPRRMAVVEHIPRTAATGQVQRARLVEQVRLQNSVLRT